MNPVCTYSALILAALLLAAPVAAETYPRVVLDEPLAGGTNAECRGGAFPPGGGWQPVAPADQLIWTLPEPMGDGKLEFEVNHFDPARQAHTGRVWLLGLWETLWASGGSVDRPNLDSIYLRYERQPRHLMAKISTHGFSFYEKNAEFVPEEWDPRRTYRFTITWSDGRVAIAVDGRHVLSWQSPKYDPVDRFRYLTLGSVVGSVARANETMTGPVYRNVRLTAFRPPPPADRSPFITGRAPAPLPADRSRVLLADDLRGATRGTAEGGRFDPAGGWTAVGPKDRIVWTLPTTVRHGAVEVSVRNFDPGRQVTGRQTTYFATWEKLWVSGGALDEPGLDAALWRAYADTPQFYVELCLRGISVYNRDQAPLAGRFDRTRTYRLRTEWVRGRVTLSVDGVPFVEWQSPDNDPFDAVRHIHIGGEPRSESILGPIYSDLRLFSYDLED